MLSMSTYPTLPRRSNVLLCLAGPDCAHGVGAARAGLAGPYAPGHGRRFAVRRRRPLAQSATLSADDAAVGAAAPRNGAVHRRGGNRRSARAAGAALAPCRRLHAGAQWYYWLRLAFQPLAIWWALYSAELMAWPFNKSRVTS